MHTASQPMLERQLRDACSRLETALKAGEPCSAEQLLRQSPDLATHKEVALELIYTEYVVRQELGGTPSPATWMDQFPQWRDDLRELFQVHELIGEETDHSARVGDETPGLSRRGPRFDLRGRRVGQYEILNEIGRGGMGVVFRARQLGLDRIVALKMILSPHAGLRDRARFRTEAEAAARLQHPHIVQILEVGEHDGCPWLSMEFVDGGSLEAMLGDAPLPARVAARLVATLARAIHCAHQRGIVHRDLKPANILLQKRSEVTDQTSVASADARSVSHDFPLTTDYFPKIADFGLAKRIGGESEVTGSGQILGTPSYMSPEQAAGRVGAIGPQADVYALGAILYRLIAGRPAFQGDSALEIIEQIRHQEPVAPRRLRPRLPRDLETICLKCLQKEPSKRYIGADELGEDLDRFLTNEPIRARRTGPAGRMWRWCQRKPAVAMLAAAVSLVCVASVTAIFWQWRRAEQHLRVTREQRDLIADERANAQRARDRAQANLEKARQAVDRLTGLGQQMGSWAGAGEARFNALQDALTFYEGFLQEQATDPAVRFETGRAHNRIGDILIDMGKWQDAWEHHDKGVVIFAKLVGEDPSNADYRTYLAKCHLGAGHAAKWDGRSQEADASYSASTPLWEELCRAAPSDLGLHIGLANTLMNHSGVLVALNRLDEAQRAITRTLALQYRLLNRSEPPGPQDIVSIVGDVMKMVSDTREAACQLSRRERWVLSEMALCIEGWSRLLEKQANREAALDCCHKTMAIRELLVAQEPNVPYHANFLARSYLRLARSLARTGPRDEEEQCYRRVISLLEKPVADFPDRYEYGQQLVDARVRLARLLAIMERLDEAEALFIAAVQSEDRLAVTGSQGITPRRGQIRFRLELAAVQLQLGHLPQASESLERAFELSASFIRDVPEQAKFARDQLINVVVTRAHLLLLDGRDAEYRRHCAWTLEQLGQVSPAYANNAAWTCVLAPDAVPDMNAVVALAEQSVDAATTERQRGNALNTLGAALYRANRFDESIQMLERSISLHGQGGSPQDWVFLALAHARLEHSADARYWIDKVAEWFEEQNSSPTPSAPVRWKSLLETRILLAEAESLVGAR